MKKVDNALTSLVLEQPFFAVLAMRLKVEETQEFPTFATDGKTLKVNPGFLNDLKPREVVTVLAHEVTHCALGHHWRMPPGADTSIWNVATDNEVNWVLEEYNNVSSGVKPFPWPSCGKVLEPRFRNMAAEKIYSVLIKEQQQQEKQGQGQKGQPGQPGKGQPSMGEVIPVPQDDKSETQEEWNKALVQALKVGQGKAPSALKELVDEITSTKTDWRQILKDYLMACQEDWSFNKPNRRYLDTGFIMPSLHNEKLGKVVFAIDTSGSISRELLAEYVAEAQNCLDEMMPESLTMVCCDTKINSVREYTAGDKISLELCGRGGTDFRPVFEMFKEDSPSVLVYLTDLYGEFPKEHPDYYVIWVTDTKDVEVPFGETIITEDK